MSKNRTLPLAVILLTGCILFIVATAVLPQEARTTAELPREAQQESDAGRYAEALKIAERYWVQGKFTEVVETLAPHRNSKMDEVFQRQVGTFLENQSSERAAMTALMIDDPTMRNSNLLAILSRQLYTTDNTPDKFDMMLGKAEKTAQFLTDTFRDDGYANIAAHYFRAGKSEPAWEAVKKIDVERHFAGRSGIAASLCFHSDTNEKLKNAERFRALIDTVQSPQTKATMLVSLAELYIERTDVSEPLASEFRKGRMKTLDEATALLLSLPDSDETDERTETTSASVLDREQWKNNVYTPIAHAMYQAGNYSSAMKLAENIPHRQNRNNLLLSWARDDANLHLPESVYRMAVNGMDDPKIKFLASFHLTQYWRVRESPEKLLEWLAATVDAFSAIEIPDEAESRSLLRVADDYRDLKQVEKAEAITELVDLWVRNLVQVEALVVKLREHLDRIASLSYSYPSAITPNMVIGRQSMPADEQASLDQRIRLAFDTTKEIQEFGNVGDTRVVNPGLINTWLIGLLHPRASKELYNEIQELFTAQRVAALDERQKIDLARRYSERFRRPELSGEEQFEGIKTLLIPLASNISLNAQDHYAREQSVHSLSEAFALLLYNGRVDEWIELFDLLDAPREFIDDVLVDTANRHFNQSRTIAGYFYRINHRSVDRSPAPDIVYRSSPSPTGILPALLAYRPGTPLDYTPSGTLPALRTQERIEKLFIYRVTDEKKKAALRDLSQRYAYLSNPPSQSLWDNAFASAQRETHADTRFREYHGMFHYRIPEGRNLLPVLKEMKVMAQGTKETGIHIQRSISLLDISWQYPGQFFSAEEQAQLRQDIDQAIEQLTSPVEKFQERLALSGVLLRGTAPPGRLLPEKSVREEHLTRLLELARNVPAESLDDRLTAYWWLVNFADHVMMHDFSIDVADEALAFGETVSVPDRGRPTLRVREAIDGIAVLREMQTKSYLLPELK